MDILIRSLILSFVLGLSGQVFYETLLPKRVTFRKWAEYTLLPVFAAGFMVIAVTKIPPFILQPVRLVVIVGGIAWCYFHVGLVKSLGLALIFSTGYWLVSLACVSLALLMSGAAYESIGKNIESASAGIWLCLMMLFRYRYKNRLHRVIDSGRKILVLFPLLSMIIVIAVCMMPWTGETIADYAGPRLTAVLGFVLINICIFYFMLDFLEKETEIQRLRLQEEHTKNRMEQYRLMRQSYEKQRRYLHDYKNQLTALRDMLENEQISEACSYLDTLTGTFRKSVEQINTNHTVVNVVLNRKYQEAADKGIAMTMLVNDLSKLTLRTEEIVTLLVNLLDNAIEACEKVKGDKVIQFKMMSEEEQLVLSVCNPTVEALRVQGSRILTGKKDQSCHGIGLLNIQDVIRERKGTSVIKCEDGWFRFSAIIPL